MGNSCLLFALICVKQGNHCARALPRVFAYSMDKVYLPKYEGGGQTGPRNQKLGQGTGEKGVGGRKMLGKVFRGVALVFGEKQYWTTEARERGVVGGNRECVCTSLGTRPLTFRPSPCRLDSCRFPS